MTDEQLIASVKRIAAARRSVGVLILIIGIILGGLSVAAIFNTKMKIDDLASVLVRADKGLECLATETSNTLSFSAGVKIGLSAGSGALWGILLIAYGRHLLWGFRKEKLLLKYHAQISGSENA